MATYFVPLFAYFKLNLLLNLYSLNRLLMHSINITISKQSFSFARILLKKQTFYNKISKRSWSNKII